MVDYTPQQYAACPECGMKVHLTGESFICPDPECKTRKKFKMKKK